MEATELIDKKPDFFIQWAEDKEEIHAIESGKIPVSVMARMLSRMYMLKLSEQEWRIVLLGRQIEAEVISQLSVVESSALGVVLSRAR